MHTNPNIVLTNLNVAKQPKHPSCSQKTSTSSSQQNQHGRRRHSGAHKHEFICKYHEITPPPPPHGNRDLFSGLN